jgi:heme-degrading monooxygenase HmoA
VVARIWNGWTKPEQADAYVAHLRENTFPQLTAIPGHRGACVLRRRAAGSVAFTVITWWESLEAIARFSGADAEVAVVPPGAQALLSAYDDRAVHWEVALDNSSGPGAK